MDEGPLRDPEFRPAATAHSLIRDPDLYGPESYRRLFGNPFLAVFGWVLLLAIVLDSDAWIDRLPLDPSIKPFLELAARYSAGFGMFAPCWLFQYHCLDCGKTGRLGRWRTHLCPAVMERRALARPLWFRVPTPGEQVVLWFSAAMVAGLIYSGLR